MIFGWLNSTRQHLSEEQLSAYVDGRPDAPSSDRVHQHLATCDATCSADLEGLRATVRVLNSIAPVTAPRSFALTAEMVADLPDGKPLGEAPAPVQTSGWRMPVLVPAAASIAAAVVFALVLVGNLSGVIEQSGSSSNNATSNAAGIGGDFEVAVEAESVAAEKAAAPMAGDAAMAEAAAAPAPAGRIAAEPAESVAEEMATESDSAFAPPSLAPAPEAAVSEALPLAPKAAPDTATLEMAPELESPEDAAADGSKVLELPQLGVFDTDAASTASALESLPVEAVAQDDAQVLPSSLSAPVDRNDDDFTLPVWQLLLATGLITALLGVVSLQLSRRDIPG